MNVFHIYRNRHDAPMRVPAINLDDAVEMTYRNHRDVEIDCDDPRFVMITTRTHLFVVAPKPLTTDLIDDIYH